MTDLQKIRQRLSNMLERINDDEIHALFADLGKAQNDPPLGEADGSLSPAKWQAAMNAARSIQEARRLTREVMA